jgi:hypothetical protein
MRDAIRHNFPDIGRFRYLFANLGKFFRRYYMKALSHGAKAAGCWLNTLEGSHSPFHIEGGTDIAFQIGIAKYGERATAGLEIGEQTAGG